MSPTVHTLDTSAAPTRLRPLVAVVSLALMAAAAVVVLVFAGEDSPSTTPAAAGAPAARVGGGPEKSLTAAATGNRAQDRPDENAIAAAVSGR